MKTKTPTEEIHIGRLIIFLRLGGTPFCRYCSNQKSTSKCGFKKGFKVLDFHCQQLEFQKKIHFVPCEAGTTSNFSSKFPVAYMVELKIFSITFLKQKFSFQLVFTAVCSKPIVFLFTQSASLYLAKISLQFQTFVLKHARFTV